MNGKTFETLLHQLEGWTSDDKSYFDFNYGCLCGTMYNIDQKPTLGPEFEIYSEDGRFEGYVSYLKE